MSNKNSIKYFIIVPDGTADERHKEYNNLSPLEYAKTPNLDFFMENGIGGIVRTIPLSIKEPGSDTANLSLLGYDPEKFKNLSRGPLEALSQNIELSDDDVIFRANCVTIKNNKMISSNAGHIPSELSFKFIDYINENLKIDGISFFKGVGYRHLLKIDLKKIKNFNVEKIKCTPPHNIVGKNILSPKNYLPEGKGSEFLISLMEKIKEVLKSCQLNKDLEYPVTTLWFWAGGKKFSIESFYKIWKLKGAVISGVDLIKGIGKAIGFDVLEVKGATGDYHSNFKNKIKAALKNINNYDLIFLHIEATDEAGHDKNFLKKVEMIEKFDKEILYDLKKYFIKNKERVRIIIVPDHPTPVRLGYHTNGEVPFVIAGKGIEKDENKRLREALKVSLRFNNGKELIKYFLKRT